MGNKTLLFLLLASLTFYVLLNVFNDTFMLFYAISLVTIAKGNMFFGMFTIFFILSIVGWYFLDAFIDYRIIVPLAILLSSIAYLKYSYVPKLVNEGSSIEFQSDNTKKTLPILVYKIYTQEN